MRQLSTGPITRIEQLIVKRLAPLVPPSITPNTISIAAGVAGILSGVCYVLASKWRVMLFAASFFFFLHWIGDALDGAVARHFNTSSKTGFYLDHMFDTVTVCAVCVGIYFSNITETALPLIFALLYLILEINILLKAVIFGTFKISVSAFGPAELSFWVIITTTLIFFFPRIFGFASGDIAAFVVVLMAFPSFFSVFFKTIKQVRILDRKS
ncbi:CDP-alcohol phosphatidyltransferase family protein [Acidobacteriota bacterium]